MRGIGNTTVVLTSIAAMTAIASFGCGGGEARHARTPSTARAASIDTPGTTRTTSAALVTTTTSTTTTSASDPARPNGATSAAGATSTARATPTTSTASAVMRIATERCDRAVACKQIGANRAFGDRDECVNAIGHAVVTSLSDDECPAGVDSDRLAACASEVEASSCDDGASAKADATPPSCSRDRLCHRDGAQAAAPRDALAPADANANAANDRGLAPTNAPTSAPTNVQTQR